VEHDGWPLGVVNEVLDAISVFAVGTVYFLDGIAIYGGTFGIFQVCPQDMDDVSNLLISDVQLFTELGRDGFNERVTFDLGVVRAVGVQQYRNAPLLERGAESG
jgi:hypothetical protein